MMANPTRPPLRSSSERRTRLTKSPATDEVENNTQQQHNTIAGSTRRSSRSTPLLTLGDDLSARPAPLSRAVSRKRPAAALIADATPETRPPTKITVTQPHGQLLRTTNGVQHNLGIAEDEVPSGISTPDAANGLSVPTNLAVPMQSTGTQTPQQAQDKRSLRSQDGGSRLKSDLAIYFSNYDDIIAGVSKSPEFLDLETPVYLVDEPLKTTKPPSIASPGSSRKSISPTRSRKPLAHSPLRRPSYASVPPSQSSTSYQILEYGSITAHIRNDGEQDPLADAMFFPHHRRAERKEKQLRNIEKERAMHEKVQLERLLEGLQGPDWLKVMGITGVTDGERKDWEPKRDYFVKEVETLVDKFRLWKEEEKRIRAEKEAALVQASREEDDEDEVETSDSDAVNLNGTESSASDAREKQPQPPKPRRPPKPHGYFLPVLPPQPLAPFTSFFAKPHLRAAALGKNRHGRNASAFGQPVPDFEDLEFELPPAYLTIEALRDHARKRRRQKRESGVKEKKEK